MEIRAIIGEIEKTKTDALVVDYFEGDDSLTEKLKMIDKALDNNISQLINQREIKGKLNEITIIHSLGKLPATRVIVLGLGKHNELTKDKIRNAVAILLRILRQKGVLEIVIRTLGAGVAGISDGDSSQAITEGALLGLYTFRKHTTKEQEYAPIKQITIMEADNSLLTSIEESLHKGQVMAEAAIIARDMVNEPSNYMTPSDMADAAKALADTYGLKLNIFDNKQMHELGMGALLGVSQGSEQLPKFIVLRYSGDDTEKLDIALVGKGITFDSGGISIKPSEGMEEMKGDMAGGAAVMAAISAIAQLKLRINIIAVIPATENMPGGRAFKPGDVLSAMNGKTIEVISTDAEGRLILADALSYTKTFDVKYIIDVATLTGACHVALGDVCTGVFGNNQKLVDKVIKAGNETGELMWQMPMFEQYKEFNKSDVADIKNSGGRWGGAVIAAQFLSEFVGDTPWVHMDIAGTSDTDKERGYILKGATGVPVRTLIELILNLTKQ
jgi:leucyl aminopeptidase